MLIKSRVSNFINKVYKSKNSIFVPIYDLIVPVHNNILAILENDYGKTLIPAHNFVTDDGEEYYAEEVTIGVQGSGTPTNAFQRFYCSTVAFSPVPSATTDAGDLASTITGSNVDKDAGYPKSNDNDADNTGAGVDTITWRVSYTKASFSDTDIEGICVGTTTTTFGGTSTDPLLAAANLTAFAKSGTDTLKILVNHLLQGA